MNQRRGSEAKGVYPEQIDLNVIPQIGAFLDSGYCQEEDKMHFEIRKILRREEIAVCATTVRVPVVYGHSVSVYAEFRDRVDLEAAAEALQKQPSLVYCENTYITPLAIGNSDDSHICRLRYGTDERSVAFWNVGHNVRLGAATNAVRILKLHAEAEGLT
jgi:aspartate-semialdehyde dehydrogenase